MGTLYVFVSTKIVAGYLNPGSNDYIIMSLIHWLAFADFWLGLGWSLNFIPLAFDLPEYSVNFCIALGVYNEFTGYFGTLWHILIAVDFIYLLSMYSNFGSNDADSAHNLNEYILSSNAEDDDYDDDLQENRFKHSIFLQNPQTYRRVVIIMIIWTFITTTFPLFISGKNEYSVFHNYYDNNGKGYGQECWLVGLWQLVYYCASFVSLLLHCTALIIACLKYKQTKSFTKAYYYLIKRLLPWIICYSIIRLVPFIERLWDWFGNNNDRIPLWFVVIHHCTISSYGLANAFVWYFTRRVDPGREYPSELSTQNEFTQMSTLPFTSGVTQT